MLLDLHTMNTQAIAADDDEKLGAVNFTQFLSKFVTGLALPQNYALPQK